MTGNIASQEDRYLLDTRIATGGMGEVWAATDTVLGREVAVKVLKQEYADDPTFRSRFAAEARHAAALDHPNIASVFDVGELTDDIGTRPFLVMELVPGQPLSALLHGGEPLPASNAADLVAQAADGIAAAHAVGIVHRDIKPANLLVTPEGRVRITDFGIARAADTVSLTRTGQVVGTPQYLSPEQAEGRPATPASDIYSLGVVLFECLTGQRPFDRGTPVSTALAHLRDPVPALPGDVPDHLRSVVDRALAKDPDDRFPTASEMAGALRGTEIAAAPATKVLSTVAAGAGVAGAGRPTARPRRAAPAWWPWAGAAAAVLVVLSAVLLAGGRDADDTTEAGSGDNRSPRTGVQPEDAGVRVRPAAYVGSDRHVAKERLEALGLEVDEERRDNPGGYEKDTVAAVEPHGLVVPDTEVTLFVWGDAPEPEPPVTEPAPDDGSDHGKGGDSGKGEKGPSDKGKKHGKSKGKK